MKRELKHKRMLRKLVRHAGILLAIITALSGAYFFTAQMASKQEEVERKLRESMQQKNTEITNIMRLIKDNGITGG